MTFTSFDSTGEDFETIFVEPEFAEETCAELSDGAEEGRSDSAEPLPNLNATMIATDKTAAIIKDFFFAKSPTDRASGYFGGSTIPKVQRVWKLLSTFSASQVAFEQFQASFPVEVVGFGSMQTYPNGWE